MDSNFAVAGFDDSFARYVALRLVVVMGDDALLLLGTDVLDHWGLREQIDVGDPRRRHVNCSSVCDPRADGFIVMRTDISNRTSHVRHGAGGFEQHD